MSYALNEPSLDREAFEAKLAIDDGSLAELVAEAVLLSENLKHSLSTVRPARLPSVVGKAMLAATEASAISPRASTVDNPRRRSSQLSVAWLTAIAASLAIAGWLALQFLTSNGNSPSQESVVQAESHDSELLDWSDATFDASALDSFVQAWTDFRSDENPIELASYSHLANDHDSLSAFDEASEVPEWLVFTSSVTPDNSEDSGLN
jgi:hypothetical protein